MEQAAKTCKPTKITVGIRVVAEAPAYLTSWVREKYGTEAYWQEVEKNLSRWAKDFDAFMRDHRSQDPVHLSTERETTTICSACKHDWEPMSDDERPGVTLCGYCGAEAE